MNISFLCRRSDEHAFRAICHFRRAATINAAFNLSSSAFGFADRCPLNECTHPLAVKPVVRNLEVPNDRKATHSGPINRNT